MAGTGIIQHNITAMSAYRNYSANYSALAKNLEKLSSGYKINRAGDDAAGLAISEKMRAQITGLQVASKNAKDGISLVQTAEGALTEVHDMLNRMVTLATQSANGTYDDNTDRVQLQKEMDQLKDEINRIADSANFNGIKLFDGSMDGEAVTFVSQVQEGKFTISADATGVGMLPGVANNPYGDLGVNTVLHNDASTATYETSFGVALHNVEFSNRAGDVLNIKIGNEEFTLTIAEDAETSGPVKGADLAQLIADVVTDGVDGYTLTSADGSTDFTGAGTITIQGQEFEVSKADDGTLKFKSTDELADVDVSMKVSINGISAATTAEYSLEMNPDDWSAGDTLIINGDEIELKTASNATAGTPMSDADLEALFEEYADYVDGYTLSYADGKLTITATEPGAVDGMKISYVKASETAPNATVVSGTTSVAGQATTWTMNGVDLRGSGVAPTGTEKITISAEGATGDLVYTNGTAKTDGKITIGDKTYSVNFTGADFTITADQTGVDDTKFTFATEGAKETWTGATTGALGTPTGKITISAVGGTGTAKGDLVYQADTSAQGKITVGKKSYTVDYVSGTGFTITADQTGEDVTTQFKFDVEGVHAESAQTALNTEVTAGAGAGGKIKVSLDSDSSKFVEFTAGQAETKTITNGNLSYTLELDGSNNLTIKANQSGNDAAAFSVEIEGKHATWSVDENTFMGGGTLANGDRIVLSGQGSHTLEAIDGDLTFEYNKGKTVQVRDTNTSKTYTVEFNGTDFTIKDNAEGTHGGPSSGGDVFQFDVTGTQTKNYVTTATGYTDGSAADVSHASIGLTGTTGTADQAYTFSSAATGKDDATTEVSGANGVDEKLQSVEIDLSGWTGGKLVIEDDDNKGDDAIEIDFAKAQAQISALELVYQGHTYTASYNKEDGKLTLTQKSGDANVGNAINASTDIDGNIKYINEGKLEATTETEGADEKYFGNWDKADLPEGVEKPEYVGDYNAQTVNPRTAGASNTERLASTTFDLTAEMVQDGAEIRIGDITYHFTTDPNYKSDDESVIAVDISDIVKKELTDEEKKEMTSSQIAEAEKASQSAYLEKVAERLSHVAQSNGNDVYTVGASGSTITVTEQVGYDNDEGHYDLRTAEGVEASLGFKIPGERTEKEATGRGLTLQIGDTAESYNQLVVNIKDTHTYSLGQETVTNEDGSVTVLDATTLDDIKITDQESAAKAVDVIKRAINQISDIRGTLGATQNRLDHTINNLSVMVENIQDAESTIRDTDIAEEMMAYTKNNILVQAAQAMLAQANMLPQGVLQLLG